jgi:hypothetical protein
MDEFRIARLSLHQVAAVVSGPGIEHVANYFVWRLQANPTIACTTYPLGLTKNVG